MDERGTCAGRDVSDVVGWAILFYAPSSGSRGLIGAKIDPAIEISPTWASPGCRRHLNEFLSQSLKWSEKSCAPGTDLKDFLFEGDITNVSFSCHITYIGCDEDSHKSNVS